MEHSSGFQGAIYECGDEWIVAYRGTTREITKRRTAEHELRQAMQKILCRRTVTGTRTFRSFQSPDIWRSLMKAQNPPIPTRDVENAAVIFVSIELSKKSWLAGIHTPLANKIGLHKIAAGDSAGLLALVHRTMRKTERGNRSDDKRSETAMEDRKKQGYF